jgi:hypothetical protein
MKILLAADGSDYTRQMLDYVGAHRAWLGSGAAISVLTVVPAVPPRAAAVLAPEVLAGATGMRLKRCSARCARC